MKYILNFLLFWRRFIVGDDSTIAIVVMWTLLFTWSLSMSFYNAWGLTPFVVVTLLSAIMYTKAKSIKASYLHVKLKFYLSVLVPFVAVTIFPLCLFRVLNGQIDADKVLIPAGLLFWTALIVSFGLRYLYIRFPVFAIFIAGLIAYLIDLLYQPIYIQAAVNLCVHTPFVSVALSILAVVLFVGAGWRSIRS